MTTPRLSRAEYIHGQMAGIYFNRWTGPMGSDPNAPEMRAWVADMRSLTMAQIDEGLKACRQDPSEWPPSPGMFKARCLGVPRFARARFEITGKPDSRSMFVRKMWEFVDAFAYRKAQQDKADRMLRDAYDLAVEFVLAGGELPQPAAGEIEDKSDNKPNVNPDPDARAAIVAKAKREIFGDGEFEELTKPSKTDEQIELMRGLYGTNPINQHDEE